MWNGEDHINNNLLFIIIHFLLLFHFSFIEDSFLWIKFIRLFRPSLMYIVSLSDILKKFFVKWHNNLRGLFIAKAILVE